MSFGDGWVKLLVLATPPPLLLLLLLLLEKVAVWMVIICKICLLLPIY